MSAALLEAAAWPPSPELRARRWRQRLLVAITDLLDATGRGHRILVDLLERLAEHPDDRLVDALRQINAALVTPVDSAALVDLCRDAAEVAVLLRAAVEHRVAALGRMRRLVELYRLGLTPRRAHVHAVLVQAEIEIAAAGRALARADAALIVGQEDDR